MTGATEFLILVNDVFGVCGHEEFSRFAEVEFFRMVAEASTLDRVRLAALAQSDADLQMPIMSPVSPDAWSVKESTATEEDEPAWGNREERAIEMEVSTAAANLTGGADAVIMRHPAAVATIKKFITELV